MERVKVFNGDCEIVYCIKDVKEIMHGKYRELYSYDDIAGNGLRPNDSVMVLYFKDGSQASFGSDWTVVFE